MNVMGEGMTAKEGELEKDSTCKLYLQVGIEAECDKNAVVRFYRTTAVLASCEG